VKKTISGVGKEKKTLGAASKGRVSLKGTFPSSSEEEEQLRKELGVSNFTRNMKANRLEQIRKEMEEMSHSEEEDTAPRRTKPKVH
jgi:hypothetical protein